MEQILSIVVRNQPGVLMRVAGMFSRRGFNIDSLAKLVEVERVKVLPPKSSATRSMILVKVKAGNKRPELLQLAEVFRAHAVDVTGESLIFVATGDEGKLRAFVDVMRPYGVTEMVQTGLVALERGDTSLAVEKSRFEWPPLDDGHAAI